MKKFLFILVSVLIVGYLIFAAFYFQNTQKNEICNRFEVIVQDSAQTKFVHPQEIKQLVKNKGLDPAGKTVKEINTLDIRDAILSNKLVKSAEVYATQDGSIIANISQRKPVLRVISDTEGSYYIDNNREKMPTSINFSVYVPIATGAIGEEFAKNDLFDFAEFLDEHPDWDAWIEQIVVKKDNKVELVPRAGDFRIVLGTLDNYPAKLAKFSLFVKKGLNVVGWNRYSEINLAYDNQVVCTKK
ncbi:MAG: hypothetical protein PHO94_10885 [Petrimonas sp.]|nr:hypothetical protein [Petrimonas sp.]